MKRRGSLILTFLVVAIVYGSPLSAQDPEGDRPNPGDKGRYEKWLEKGPMARLTPEEQLKYRAARLQAFNDPDVKALAERLKSTEKSFRDTMSKVMLQQDPTLESILNVMKKARDRGESEKDKGSLGDANDTVSQNDRVGGPEAFGELTPEEHQKLHAATQQANQMPEVHAAMQNEFEIEKIFTGTLNNKMLKADPSLGPILDKINEAINEHPGFDAGPRYQREGPAPNGPPGPRH